MKLNINKLYIYQRFIGLLHVRCEKWRAIQYENKQQMQRQERCTSLRRGNKNTKFIINLYRIVYGFLSFVSCFFFVLFLYVSLKISTKPIDV